MVTNSLVYADQADLIIVLDRGEICESGTFLELMQHEGIFFDLVQGHLNKKRSTQITGQMIVEESIGSE